MSNVKYEKQNSIVKITLARPDVRNAFNSEMIQELTEAFGKASEEEGVRALLLEGEGTSFCAGADLQWMKSMVNFTREENQSDSQKLFDMFLSLQTVPVPVIGHIHGHAMGGALGLVALCDIVAIVEGTKLSFSEVKLGLAPAVISSFVAKKIPRAQSHRWLLTGEVFSAGDALRMGLAHYTGSSENCNKFIVDTIQKILANGPKAVRATKQLIQDVYSGAEDIEKKTIDLIAELRVGEEGQEGLSAFFEKRKANWTP